MDGKAFTPPAESHLKALEVECERLRQEAARARGLAAAYETDLTEAASLLEVCPIPRDMRRARALHSLPADPQPKGTRRPIHRFAAPQALHHRVGELQSQLKGKAHDRRQRRCLSKAPSPSPTPTCLPPSDYPCPHLNPQPVPPNGPGTVPQPVSRPKPLPEALHAQGCGGAG